ncbi:MAG: PRC-barrel domain containing protein, partial [Planctomycetaceae bacterium]
MRHFLQRFQETPTLEDDWSVVEDPEWAANLDAYYGLEDMERPDEPQTYRVSQLSGTQVRDRTGMRALGNLREIVFEMETGEIRYGALAHGGFLGFG